MCLSVLVATTLPRVLRWAVSALELVRAVSVKEAALVLLVLQLELLKANAKVADKAALVAVKVVLAVPCRWESVATSVT